MPIQRPSSDQENQHINRLRNDIRSIRASLREINGTLYDIQAEFDMLIRILRATKTLKKKDYERFRELMSKKYRLMDEYGRYQGRILLTKYGCFPEKKKDGNNPI